MDEPVLINEPEVLRMSRGVMDEPVLTNEHEMLRMSRCLKSL